MDINVTKVEVQANSKFGPKKVLYVADGTKWNVAEKKPFYGLITGPGIYSVEIADFQGKPYIKYLSKKSGSNAPANAAGASVSKPVGNFDYKAKMEADKARQNEIALEFYCGLVKDVMIANKKDGEGIDLLAIQEAAYSMLKNHKKLVEMLDAQEEIAEPEVKTTYQKAAEALAEEGIPV